MTTKGFPRRQKLLWQASKSAAPAKDLESTKLNFYSLKVDLRLFGSWPVHILFITLFREKSFKKLWMTKLLDVWWVWIKSQRQSLLIQQKNLYLSNQRVVKYFLLIVCHMDLDPDPCSWPLNSNYKMFNYVSCRENIIF